MGVMEIRCRGVGSHGEGELGEIRGQINEGQCGVVCVKLKQGGQCRECETRNVEKK
jgi:hypothetical protein